MSLTVRLAGVDDVAAIGSLYVEDAVEVVEREPRAARGLYAAIGYREMGVILAKDL